MLHHLFGHFLFCLGGVGLFILLLFLYIIYYFLNFYLFISGPGWSEALNPPASVSSAGITGVHHHE
jgi:hypothetical protein